MTLYSVSNRSTESIDPHKQPLQNPPTYSESVASHQEQHHQHHQQRQQEEQQQQQQEQQQQPPQQAPSKPTIGERFHKISSKAGWPLNKAANAIGAEGWWPSSMEKECNKAARILHSFTSEALENAAPPKTNGPFHVTGLTRKSMVKIPPPVLQNCAGLAIFNVLRGGAGHGSLSAGSGVVVARRADGTWSPPSSFVISTLGAGLMFGLDLYDCVCVLNTREQVDAFANPRFSLGAEGSIAVGPVGTGGHLESAVSKTVRPMWSYMKSRGLWVGLQIDGTIVVSRGDANSLFYEERGITARRILQDDVAWPLGAKPLFEVLKAIEGRIDFDRTVIQEVARQPTPGDAILDAKRQIPIEPERREQQVPEGQDHTSADTTEEAPKYETAMEEKERLAKSGY
ncbi:Fc.00g075320.m01.CDS01 [Cosmosporella sp. VM-42]